MDAQIWLKEVFEEKKRRNRHISLRSFSRTLGISPAQLSQLMSGKRKLSAKMADKVSFKLGLSPREKRELQTSLLGKSLESSEETGDKRKRQLSEDEFSFIADWWHYSILSLSEIKGSLSDPRWVSSRLGIGVAMARDGLDRLRRLGLLRTENGKMRPSGESLKTSDTVLSPAIQRHHVQNLRLAEAKIESVPLNLREFSSITMAIDPKKLKRAKRLMTNFKRELCELMESGNPSEVYTFSMQLFPNTLVEEGKKGESK